MPKSEEATGNHHDDDDGTGKSLQREGFNNDDAMRRNLRRRRIFVSLVIPVVLLMLNALRNVRLVKRLFSKTPKTSLANNRRQPLNESRWTNETHLEERVIIGERLTKDLATDSELPLCNRDQIKNGEWKQITLEAPPYVSMTTHLRCHPKEFYETERPWRTWDWQPLDSNAESHNTCRFSSWNATEFCQLLPAATVSIIGDSLSWEQWSSLLQLLGARVRQKSQHWSKSHKKNHVQVACQTGRYRTYFVFRNDPRLTAEQVRDSIGNEFPQVLVLNRGAHYVNDTELVRGTREELLPALDEWMDVCRRRQVKCHLLWRTTVPGHPHCDPYTEPINDLTAMEALIHDVNNYNSTTINYHWRDFSRQNQLVLKELSSWWWQQPDDDPYVTFDVMDAYEINLRRPDGHRINTGDCLHNCYPGKMDVYNQLLLHFLKIHRSQQDVDRLVTLYEDFLQRQAKALKQNQTSS
jgi:hypothetical protein